MVDLLKLAYHSFAAGGGGGAREAPAAPTASGGAASQLWSLLESLMRGGAGGGEMRTAVPEPFTRLPLLLRDEALALLRREAKGVATAESAHPLPSSAKLGGAYRLHVPAAAQLRVSLDCKSELSGTGHLLFTSDEAGVKAIGRYDGSHPTSWRDLLVAGDTVWVRPGGAPAARGTRERRKSSQRTWGWRVRASAAGWTAPKGEASALEAPLAFGWEVLELLSTHRPHELLTRHTYFALVRYLHAGAAPQRTRAASLLIKLLKLETSELASSAGYASADAFAAADPRDAWPLDPVLALEPLVTRERAAQRAAGSVHALLPTQAQLLAELVAIGYMKRAAAAAAAPPPLPPVDQWVTHLAALSAAVRFLLPLRGAPPPDPFATLPRPWLARLQDESLELLLLSELWDANQYAALVAHALRQIGGKGGQLLGAKPRTLAASATGALSGSSVPMLQVRFALLQLFNKTLTEAFAFVFTGCASLPHTLGATLAEARAIIFPEVKRHWWGAALDALAPERTVEEIKADPPPTITVNRHRAATERADSRAKARHSVFAQLQAQLNALERGRLRRRDRAFKVKFAGEAADDQGGPYREVFRVLCTELEQPELLPLLLQTPNGRHHLGANREKFLLQPASSSAEALHAFEFVGVLMALAILQQETVLSLNLCSVVWKALAQERADGADLAGFDEAVQHSLVKLEHIEAEVRLIRIFTTCHTPFPLFYHVVV